MARQSRRQLGGSGPARAASRAAIVLCLLALGACSVGVATCRTEPGSEGAPAAQGDPWGPLRLLVGTWDGAISGQLGTGTGVREYELILDESFLLYRQASVRIPQEASPAGDFHRELCIFSYDTERETIVLREFFVEGVVSRSTCDIEGSTVTCIAEEIENGTGMQARLTLEIHDAFSFDEVYELAFPGEELSVYFTNHWTRRPELE
jgi:hypothetical protein